MTGENAVDGTQIRSNLSNVVVYVNSAHSYLRDPHESPHSVNLLQINAVQEQVHSIEGHQEQLKDLIRKDEACAEQLKTDIESLEVEIRALQDKLRASAERHSSMRERLRTTDRRKGENVQLSNEITKVLPRFYSVQAEVFKRMSASCERRARLSTTNPSQGTTEIPSSPSSGSHAAEESDTPDSTASEACDDALSPRSPVPSPLPPTPTTPLSPTPESPQSPDMQQLQEGEIDDGDGDLATTTGRQDCSAENVPGSSSTSSHRRSPRQQQQQPEAQASSSSGSKRSSSDGDNTEPNAADKLRKRTRKSDPSIRCDVYDLEAPDRNALVASYPSFVNMEKSCGYKNLRRAFNQGDGVLYGRWRVIKGADPNATQTLEDPVTKQQFENWMRKRRETDPSARADDYEE